MKRVRLLALLKARRELLRRRRLARAAMRVFDRNYDMLRQNARHLGYALAVHGSLLRDVDLVAVPWTPDAKPARQLKESLFKLLLALYRGKRVYTHRRAGRKPHGRVAYTIHVDGTYIDLSVMPRRT